MSAPADTFVSANAKGNREDLTDVIYRITPTVTPFISMASKGKASNTIHEWQVQDLAAASASNAQIEGDDAVNKAVTATVRLTNYTQISTKTVQVSGTQRAMNPAGRGDEMAYQMSLAALELRRDMESSATQSSVAVTGTRAARGLPGWCVDNTSKDSGTTLAIYPTTGGAGTVRTNSGATRAFTEAQLKSVLQLCYTAGGEPDTILMGPAAKQTFSTFTGNSTRMDKSEDAKLYSAIDVYVSDFGELKAVPSRFQLSRDIFILQADKWSVNYLRPFSSVDLAKSSDSDRKMLSVEWTIEARAPKANGAVYDIS